MQAGFMKEKKLLYPILFFAVVILDVLLIVYLKEEAKTIVRLDEEAMMQTLRNQQVAPELYETFITYESEGAAMTGTRTCSGICIPILRIRTS